MPRDDREQNFDKALARSLRSSNVAPGDECLDAEILAAYHERLLNPDEMAERKAHIASCERCMEILAQLEATDTIPVEADRDLLLDQIVLEIPESTPAGAAAESAPMAAESAPLNETTPMDVSPTEVPPIEMPLSEASSVESEITPDPEIIHDPELVPAFSAAPSVELPRAATPVPVAPVAAKLVPSSATITFRSPREDRPKMVRYVAIAGALAAGLIFWLVYRDHSNSFDLAQNRPASKIELPPQSPAPAAPPEEKAASSSSSEPNALTPQSSVSPAKEARAQSQPAPSKTPTDTVANALDDAKKTVDTARALEQKSRKDAAGQAPVFVPSGRDESAASGGLYSARALPPAGRSASPRKFETVNGSSADNGRAGAATQSVANSPSGIPATPPPARTKMNPGVVNEAVTVDAAAPALLQKSASAALEESQSRRATGRVIATLNPLSVPAPGGTTIWRIGQAGMIQHSSNSGTTWSIQPSGVVSDLIAGSAYSDQICWLVGRNGTILRTTNGGAAWQKINSPSNDDLLAVFSINADTATITDAAGRAFETTSAGARWARTRIQQ